MHFIPALIILSTSDTNPKHREAPVSVRIPQHVSIFHEDIRHVNELRFQEQQMALLFSDVLPEALPPRDCAEFFKRGDFRQYIRWCDEGYVRSVEFSSKRMGQLRIDHLPSTVEYVNINNCGQHYQIQTRMIPRQCMTFNMSNNQICGFIDLTALPGRLIFLHLSKNKIPGRIVLRDLPNLLREIKLSNNSITQEVVYYDVIPRKTVSIDLRGNKIKRVESFMGGAGEPADKRIRIGKAIVELFW